MVKNQLQKISIVYCLWSWTDQWTDSCSIAGICKNRSQRLTAYFHQFNHRWSDFIYYQPHKNVTPAVRILLPTRCSIAPFVRVRLTNWNVRSVKEVKLLSSWNEIYSIPFWACHLGNPHFMFGFFLLSPLLFSSLLTSCCFAPFILLNMLNTFAVF